MPEAATEGSEADPGGLLPRVAAVLGALAAALLGLVALIAAFDLVSWIALKRSYAALDEFVAVLMVWFGLISAAFALAEGSHVAVALLADRLSGAGRRAVERCADLAVAGFGLLLAVFGRELTAAATNTLPGTGWPAAVQYQPTVWCGALLAVLGLAAAFVPRTGTRAASGARRGGRA